MKVLKPSMRGSSDTGSNSNYQSEVETSLEIESSLQITSEPFAKSQLDLYLTPVILKQFFLSQLRAL